MQKSDYISVLVPLKYFKLKGRTIPTVMEVDNIFRLYTNMSQTVDESSRNNLKCEKWVESILVSLRFKT